MTLLVQITDTHVIERGTLLYAWPTRRGSWPNNMSWEDLKDRMRGSMVVNLLP